MVHAATDSEGHAGENSGTVSGEVEVDESFIGGKARNMHKSRKCFICHYRIPLLRFAIVLSRRASMASVILDPLAALSSPPHCL